MDDGIYLVQGKSLVPMKRQPYEGEGLLQVLLADHPQLLAGGHESPRRLMLIEREAGIPDQEGGSGRWSIDHLYLDQDAVPTLVEVKRSSDTRIRREVIGQVLEYAANAVIHWNPEELASRFEATCLNAGVIPSERLAELIGSEVEEETFWLQAKVNLIAGRIRMVIVSDEIRPELRRIVEFLNEQMSPAELIAIEVQQYVGDGISALVPRVVGDTSRAAQSKSVRSTAGIRWDSERFFGSLADLQNPLAAQMITRLFQWTEQMGLSVKWGSGKVAGRVIFLGKSDLETRRILNMWTDGSVNVYVPAELDQLPLDSRAKIIEELDALPGKAAGKVIPGSPVKIWINQTTDTGVVDKITAVLQHMWPQYLSNWE